MARVMCRECRKTFDRDKLKEGIDWVMPSKNYYYHKDCYELWVSKRQNKKDYTSTKEDEEYIRDIYDYLTKDLKIAIDGAKVHSQIKNFLKEGKKVKGILFTLIYFYDIKHGDIEKSKGGIGIVPYIYDEAREYWRKQVSQQFDIMEQIQKQLQNRSNRTKIKIIKTTPRAMVKNHFDEIEEGEDDTN